MGAKARKAYKGQGMEGIFAKFYDRNAKGHMMDQYLVWASVLKEIVQGDARLLELAPGPGYLSIELHKSGVKNITGLDISESLVEIARGNAERAGASIKFVQGNAAAMPFPDAAFTHIVCTSAFKNFSEPTAALNEMHRVLAPGGVVWLSDMRQDVSDAEIDGYVRNAMKLKGFDAFMTALTFKGMLRKRAYTKDGILGLISETRFEVVDFKQFPMEFQVTMRKGAAGR
ncbi:MAG: hypothetical protein A2Z99_09065 [Treponema sp. GWB1_62_6]|nr:MAG: hypothetical protein A2Y36_13890 [Treponema sp. GWA1_62_8]OHE63986.1 MAG: hypothetical protein A2Z99_09065 [Treponema sp. GWB1_62_6]OHE68521.1 MAG: hypothetical protein A2413_04880 [Treponema sp. RIFOXYC1_FULL_61_9]OHE70183.1 MAG: hypothetical protein A2001_06870 [Treponema sp. GWC1_61_84]